MENTKKVTKREYFERIRKIVIEDKELVTFIDHELELLAKKNSRGGTSKTQMENIKVAEMLVDELRKINKPMTITDLMNSSEDIKKYRLENGNPLSNQKISAIFKQLVENKTLTKITEKKKSYFSIAE